MDENYDYTVAGFSPFLTKSVDDGGALSLDQLGDTSVTREINYDQSPTTGQLSSITRVGNIELDGVKGRITIFDENGNQAVWVGDIDG